MSFVVMASAVVDGAVFDRCIRKLDARPVMA